MKINFKNSVLNFCSIEQEIAAIFKGIETTLEEDLVVQRTHPSKGATFSKGEIRIYKREDIKRMKEDKTFKAQPLERFVFYTDTLRPSKIGSVAIYGEKVFIRYLSLNRVGFLFGRKIVCVKVEQGLRPFVDVKLVA